MYDKLMALLERMTGMARYLSLDLETTGLDPLKDQVLEVGVVLDDLQNPKPLKDLPTFHCYIKHDRIAGHPVALAMNAAIIAKLAESDKFPDYTFCTTECFVHDFRCWLEANGYEVSPEGRIKDRVVIAGKNAASFDLPFLRAMTMTKRSFSEFGQDEFYHFIRPAHRVIDPAMFYMRTDDEIPPSLPECMRRAGMSEYISHRAIDDAMAVVRLIRHHFQIVEALPVEAGLD